MFSKARLLFRFVSLTLCGISLAIANSQMTVVGDADAEKEFLQTLSSIQSQILNTSTHLQVQQAEAQMDLAKQQYINAKKPGGEYSEAAKNQVIGTAVSAGVSLGAGIPVGRYNQQLSGASTKLQTEFHRTHTMIKNKKSELSRR